jgi:hypothetical protein
MKTVLIAALSLTVVSCQQQSSDPGPEKTPPAAEKPAAPADPADASSYVGMTLAEGRARAEKTGIRWRVIEEDGKSRPVTMDYRPDRLNFVVAGGKIIRVTKG